MTSLIRGGKVARKTVYVPDALLATFEAANGDDAVNLSQVFQEFLRRTAEKITAMNLAVQSAGAAPYWTTVRPSMVRSVQQGASYWTSVDLVEMGDLSFGQALRVALETMHIRVNLFSIGTPQHLMNVLGGAEATAPYLVISGVSAEEDGSIPLPELAEPIAALQPFNGRLSIDQLRSFLDVPGRTVVSLWGDMGREDIADAFLDAGCRAYIGPVGCPFRHSAMLFLTGLFYELTQQRDIEAAVAKLAAIDTELAMYRLRVASRV